MQEIAGIFSCFSAIFAFPDLFRVKPLVINYIIYTDTLRFWNLKELLLNKEIYFN